MSTRDWDLLLDMVEPHITKKNTKMRLAISPRERLYLTLRFLATGPFTADDRWCSSALHFSLVLFVTQEKRSGV